MPRKKSLLIGINYIGSEHALNGCHQDVANMQEYLSYRGYDNDPRSQVVLLDTAQYYNTNYAPTGHNILAAMDWLVSEPGTCCFLHYSGHGGQIRDPDGDRSTGLDDSLVPVDFEQRGQIGSAVLHEHLVSHLAPNSTLFVVMDCCHSGSAIELPFVYRSDSDGNVNLMDNIRQGMHLVGVASDLISGGFSFNKVGEARELFAGATSFFRGMTHRGDQGGQAGVSAGEFQDEWGSEQRVVTMLSGCRDDQPSADASIAGKSCGAMTWAFLETMKRVQNPTYVQALQMTRQLLDQSHYTQVPQLSLGVNMDLDRTTLIL